LPSSQTASHPSISPCKPHPLLKCTCSWYNYTGCSTCVPVYEVVADTPHRRRSIVSMCACSSAVQYSSSSMYCHLLVLFNLFMWTTGPEFGVAMTTGSGHQSSGSSEAGEWYVCILHVLTLATCLRIYSLHLLSRPQFCFDVKCLTGFVDSLSYELVCSSSESV